jgi:CheY-like chemotaxis protein
VSLVAPLAQSRSIAVDVERSSLLDRAVIADRQRLSQVLLNLLSNAVKYNREAGSVIVGVERVLSGMLRINVTDTGSGIPPQKLRLLFRPFERLGAETTSIEGTGLGLTLARGLAEAMGGGVGVVSRLDEGSTFWVDLLEAPDGAVDGPHHLARSVASLVTLGPATVLYVEDNVANVRLMQRILGQHPGLRLITAGDGQSGLDQARAQEIDLVLLDLHLPDITGEQVLLHIQSDPRLRHIPVIVLSADATPGQIKRLKLLGAAEYLTKPFEIQSVVNVLARVLQASKAAPSADERGDE